MTDTMRLGRSFAAQKSSSSPVFQKLAAKDFLGLSFDCAAPEAAMEQIIARPTDAPFAYVITPNVDHVVRLRCARSDLWPAYRHAWLTLCDSRILARLAAHAEVQLPVTTGSDLTESLFSSGMARDDRIAVLGGDPAMIETLRTQYGYTNLVHHNPPMGFITDQEQRFLAIDFIVNARARFTFLAVGSPQQEILAHQVARCVGAIGIGLCIGASLEFLCGKQTRAPRLLQKLSMEWLFRLFSDPMRLWRRYLVDGPMIFSIFRHCQHFARRWH